MNKASHDTLELFVTVSSKDPHNALLQEIRNRHGKTPSYDLMQEILKDGSNTIATLFRGNPVEYDEIVRDVADKLDVEYENIQDYKDIELCILAKVAEEMQKKSGDNIITIPDENGNTKSFDVNKGEFAKYISSRVKGANKEAIAKILMAVLMNIAVKYAMREGLKQIVKMGGKRLIGALIPGLNVLMTAWLILDIAGPAYRKTIPTVINIAMLRLQETCDD